MKKAKSIIIGLLLRLLELAVGIVLFIDPMRFTKDILCILGLVLMAAGIASIVRYFRTPAETAVQGQKLTLGLLALTAGIFCGLKAEWILSALPVLPFIYGAMLVVSSISKLQWGVNILRLKKQRWFLPVISAGLTALAGVVIFWKPFGAEGLWNFTAVAFIILSVLDFAAWIFSGKDKPSAVIPAVQDEAPAVQEIQI